MSDRPEIHPTATCDGARLGAGTVVEAFAHVHNGVQIGDRCVVREGAIVEAGATIADDVTIGMGAIVIANVRLEDRVLVGAKTTFTREARSSTDGSVDPDVETVVRANAELGAGAIVLAGVEVGRNAIVAPGTVVTRSVPPHALVAGNPGEIIRYLDTEVESGSASDLPASGGGVPINVDGVHVHHFQAFTDFRGSLTAGEMPTDAIPFTPRRWFLVYGVPNRELRGEHAHRECHQFLICVAGSVVVAVDDGDHRAEVLLDRPSMGIYIPPLVWGSQFRYEPDTVLFVLASHPYDGADYIRDYEEYLRIVAQTSPAAAG